MFVDVLTTIASTVFVLGVLIFIHELGHFIVAKKVGIRVEKFSLGFPPNIFSKTKGETEYCIGIIPLGGYVKMAGENPDETVTGDPREFMSKTIGQRAAVIFAGPFMNYVLAMFLLCVIFFGFGRAMFDDHHVIVGELVKDGPAMTAGLAEGDMIIALNNQPVQRFDSLATNIYKIVGGELSLTWVHNTDTITKMITTEPKEILNAEGKPDTIGIIGFNQKIIGYERYGFLESVQKSFVTTHFLVWETAKFIKKYFTGQVPANMIGGPIFIAQQSGKEAKKGPSSLFFFMALLSVNLAVLNVLPIPILDGGHLVFLMVEKIKGSPVPLRVRAIAQQVGLVILLCLIILVTYNDIIR